jgi:hypothetical protein
MDDRRVLLRRIRVFLGLFAVALVLSGLTAVPLRWETQVLGRLLDIPETASPHEFTGLRYWIATVRQGLRETYAEYPFIAYGTDWLAFAHVIIAVAFIGPLRDPVRNRWVIDWGLIACLGVIPVAVIFGPLRGIPFYWRLIDCAFGVVGFVPLWLARRYAVRLEQLERPAAPAPSPAGSPGRAG